MRVAWDNWSLIGRWLGNRRVNREIGYPVYSDPGDIWEVVAEGFCSFKSNEIKYLYVLPEFRGGFVGCGLVSSVLDSSNEAWTVRANKNSHNLFLRFGFHGVSCTKNFTLMRREANAQT